LQDIVRKLTPRSHGRMICNFEYRAFNTSCWLVDMSIREQRHKTHDSVLSNFELSGPNDEEVQKRRRTWNRHSIVLETQTVECRTSDTALKALKVGFYTSTPRSCIQHVMYAKSLSRPPYAKWNPKHHRHAIFQNPIQSYVLTTQTQQRPQPPQQQPPNSLALSPRPRYSAASPPAH
jgi:hypothetical protein